MTIIQKEPRCYGSYNASSLCVKCNFSMACEMFIKEIDELTKDTP